MENLASPGCCMLKARAGQISALPVRDEGDACLLAVWKTKCSTSSLPCELKPEATATALRLKSKSELASSQIPSLPVRWARLRACRARTWAYQQRQKPCCTEVSAGAFLLDVAGQLAREVVVVLQVGAEPMTLVSISARAASGSRASAQRASEVGIVTSWRKCWQAVEEDRLRRAARQHERRERALPVEPGRGSRSWSLIAVSTCTPSGGGGLRGFRCVDDDGHDHRRRYV